MIDEINRFGNKPLPVQCTRLSFNSKKAQGTYIKVRVVFKINTLSEFEGTKLK